MTLGLLFWDALQTAPWLSCVPDGLAMRSSGLGSYSRKEFNDLKLLTQFKTVAPPLKLKSPDDFDLQRCTTPTKNATHINNLWRKSSTTQVLKSWSSQTLLLHNNNTPQQVAFFQSPSLIFSNNDYASGQNYDRKGEQFGSSESIFSATSTGNPPRATLLTRPRPLLRGARQVCLAQLWIVRQSPTMSRLAFGNEEGPELQNFKIIRLNMYLVYFHNSRFQRKITLFNR